MNLSRRGFIGSAATTVAAIGATSFAHAADEDNRWIDAHVHVWTPDLTTYPLSPRFKQSNMKPASFTPEELFAHCRPAGVDRIVLIQMSFYEFDNSYMLKVIKQNPKVFSGVGIVDYKADDLKKQMSDLKRQGVRGLRLHSRGDAKEWVDSSAMASLWNHAAKIGIAVCPLINPEDLAYVDALCTKFPDTTVVVDHFARVGISGTVEREPLNQLCKLARFPNTHVKTSAFYALGKKQPPYTDLTEMIRKVTDSFGPDRLMWASDCPFQVQGNHTYEASIALIRDKIDFLSESDKQWMLRGTAEKVFF